MTVDQVQEISVSRHSLNIYLNSLQVRVLYERLRVCLIIGTEIYIHASSGLTITYHQNDTVGLKCTKGQKYNSKAIDVRCWTRPRKDEQTISIVHEMDHFLVPKGSTNSSHGFC